MGMIFSSSFFLCIAFCSVIKNFLSQCVLLWRTAWTCVKANRSARAADRRKVATDSANTTTTTQSSSTTPTTASSVPPPSRKSTYYTITGDFLPINSSNVSHHRLNMEVDLQSLFGLNVTWCAQLFSLAETPQLPHSPRSWTRITRALLVSKDRRHLFVTLCFTCNRTVLYST